MDKANYQLAWHLADRLGREVYIVAHSVAEPLASHPLVRAQLVRRPFGRHVLGSFFLNRAGRQKAAELTRACPSARVVVNGGNCCWSDANWVHMVHHACPCVDSGTPWWFRTKNRLTHQRNLRRERAALQCSRVVLANSARTRDEVLAHFALAAERVHVVYLGVDAGHYGQASPQERATARNTFGLDNNHLVFLFVGALGYDRRKGFDTLLTAFKQLQVRFSRTPVLLAAGGGALDHWRGMAASMGLADHVRFLGHTDCIPTLLSAADILVSPVRHEPYGLNVHEALCRGVPAIVSKTAGVAERYPAELHDLLLLDPENATDLAERLCRCAAQLEEYRRRVAALGTTLRARTWDHVAADIVRLVEEH
jgi:glycosyltransferase involved in cell wall biosynthesis